MEDILASALVTEDLACIHCGYNLRGLAEDGRCPECFTFVAQSTRGDLLQHADAIWLDTVRKGTRVKLWGIAFTIVLGILAGIAVAAGLPIILVELVALAGGGLSLWGAFLITTKEPRFSLVQEKSILRKGVRVCAIIAFCGALVGGIGRALSTLIDVSVALREVLMVIGRLLNLVGVVVLFGELALLRSCALRVPDQRLAKSTRTLIWLLPTSNGILCLMSVVMMIFGPKTAFSMAAAGATGAQPTWAIVLFMGFSCVVSPFALVCLIWYILLLFKYKSVFAWAAQISRMSGGSQDSVAAALPLTTTGGNS